MSKAASVPRRSPPAPAVAPVFAPVFAPMLALAVVAVTTTVFPAAAPLDGTADECAIQRALLGKAGPGCPPGPPPPGPPAALAPFPPVAGPPRDPSPPVAQMPIAQPPAVAAPAPVGGASRPAPAAPPSAPTLSPPPLPPAATAERGTDFLILFEFGSEKISPASEALLKRIATVMNAPAAANARFHIVGHTDGVGSSASNMALSQRRAAAVKAWLIETGGVAAHRLEASGKGKEKLADPAHPQAPANRRVEIITRP